MTIEFDPWHHDTTKVAELARWLEVDHDADVLMSMLDEPWHWDAEYTEMVYEQSAAA